METLPGPFLVDNMKDEASNSFGAFPERLYIILDGKIVYQVLKIKEMTFIIQLWWNLGWCWTHGLSSWWSQWLAWKLFFRWIKTLESSSHWETCFIFYKTFQWFECWMMTFHEIILKCLMEIKTYFIDQF